MALETVNNFHAGLKFDPAGPSIVASKGIASVVVNGVGDFTVTLVDEIGLNEHAIDGCVEGQAPAFMSAERTNPTTWNIFVEDFAGAKLDTIWNFNVYRLPAL